MEDEKQTATNAVKIMKQDDNSAVLGGYGVVWGSASETDLEGDYFTPETNFHLENLKVLPVYYDHALGEVKHQLGQVLKTHTDDFGLWVEAELDKGKDYVKQVLELVEKGAMGWSSQAIASLVQRAEDGWLKNWALGELSLTLTPAEPKTIINTTRIKQQLNIVEDAEQEAERKTADSESVDDIEPLLTEEVQTEQIIIDEEIIMENEINELKTQIEELKGLVSQPVKTAGFDVAPVEVIQAKEKDSQVKSWNRFLRYGQQEDARKAVLQEGVPAQAGYLVPEFWLSKVFETMTEMSILGQLGADIRSGLRGFKSVHVLSSDAVTAAVLTAECDPYNDNDMTIAEKLLNPYKYTASTIVTQELLEDADNLADMLAMRAGKSFALAENGALINGTGTGQPEGIVAGSAFGATAASATAIAFADLNALFFSVPHYNRTGGSLRWVMADSTFQAISGLVDGENRPLLQPDLQAEFAGRIFGVPVVITNSMPAIGAGLKSVILGDFSNFVVGRWHDVSALVDPYSLASTGKIQYLWHNRMGAVVANNDAIRHLIH